MEGVGLVGDGEQRADGGCVKSETVARAPPLLLRDRLRVGDRGGANGAAADDVRRAVAVRLLEAFKGSHRGLLLKMVVTSGRAMARIGFLIFADAIAALAVCSGPRTIVV